MLPASPFSHSGSTVYKTVKCVALYSLATPGGSKHLMCLTVQMSNAAGRSFMTHRHKRYVVCPLLDKLQKSTATGQMTKPPNDVIGKHYTGDESDGKPLGRRSCPARNLSRRIPRISSSSCSGLAGFRCIAGGATQQQQPVQCTS